MKKCKEKYPLVFQKYSRYFANPTQSEWLSADALKTWTVQHNITCSVLCSARLPIADCSLYIIVYFYIIVFWTLAELYYPSKAEDILKG